jgi:hypothetical protein
MVKNHQVKPNSWVDPLIYLYKSNSQGPRNFHTSKTQEVLGGSIDLFL